MGKAAEQINPNEEMVEHTPLSLSGNAQISFDDLEKLDLNSSKDDDVNDKPVVVKPSQRENDNEKEEIEDQDDDEEGEEEGDDEGSEEGSDDNESDIDADDGEKSELLKQAEQSTEKKFKGKDLKAIGADGEEFVLNTGATVPVKVDGEIKNVQLQQIINDYSGKVSYDQKFSELDNQKNDLISKAKDLNSYVNNIWEKAKELDSSEEKGRTAYEIINMIAGLAGHDARALATKIRGAFFSEAKQLNDMTESEIEKWELQQELAYRKIDDEISLKQRQDAAKKTEQQQKEEQLLGKYGLDRNVYDDLRSEIEQHTGETAQPEQVVQYSRIKLAHTAIKAFDSSKLSDESLRNQLANFAIDNPNATEKDLLDVLANAFPKGKDDQGSKAAKNIKRKLGNTGQTSKKTKAKSNVRTNKKLRSASDLWEGI